MNKKISVVVLTKDRAHLLQKCLGSLRVQSTKPDEVVVVDNGSTDNTKQIVEEFQMTLIIRYVYTTLTGYPSLYNMGIQHSSGAWIAFLDDDCIASRGWLRAIKNSTKTNPSAVYQGKTLSIPKGNLYADIMGDHYKNWIKVNTVKDKIMKTFDNKNLCIPRSIINKYGDFDETLKLGSEDIDLGNRYSRNGVTIIYNARMLARHHERSTYGEFVRQHSRIAASEAIIDHRAREGQKISLVKKTKLLLNLESGATRLVYYALHAKMSMAFMLIVAYMSLALIRFWTYYATAWKAKKLAL